MHQNFYVYYLKKFIKYQANIVKKKKKSGFESFKKNL